MPYVKNELVDPVAECDLIAKSCKSIQPTFIGIGAPKAGTTWLSKCLSEHPDVYMAPIKETEFFKFDDCLTRLDEYSRYFAGANGERAVGEFTVRYMAMEEVPGRIAAAFPDIKIVASLRNPVEQVQSWYWHLQRQDRFGFDQGNGVPGFSEAMDRFSDLLLNHAFYARHLTNWFCHFDRTRVKIVFYDDICASPLAVLRDLFQFLEVNTRFEPPSSRAHDSSVRRGTSPRTRVAGSLHRSVYRALNCVYEPLKRVIGTSRAAALRDRLRIRQSLERLFHKPGYPGLDDRTRARLVDTFSTDVQMLSRMVDRDLSPWLR